MDLQWEGAAPDVKGRSEGAAMAVEVRFVKSSMFWTYIDDSVFPMYYLKVELVRILPR